MGEQNRNLVRLFMGELDSVELTQKVTSKDKLDVLNLVGVLGGERMFRDVLDALSLRIPSKGTASVTVKREVAPKRFSITPYNSSSCKLEVGYDGVKYLN